MPPSKRMSAAATAPAGIASTSATASSHGATRRAPLAEERRRGQRESEGDHDPGDDRAAAGRGREGAERRPTTTAAPRAQATSRPIGEQPDDARRPSRRRPRTGPPSSRRRRGRRPRRAIRPLDGPLPRPTAAPAPGRRGRRRATSAPSQSMPKPRNQPSPNPMNGPGRTTRAAMASSTIAQVGGGLRPGCRCRRPAGRSRPSPGRRGCRGRRRTTRRRSRAARRSGPRPGIARCRPRRRPASARWASAGGGAGTGPSRLMRCSLGFLRCVCHGSQDDAREARCVNPE